MIDKKDLSKTTALVAIGTVISTFFATLSATPVTAQAIEEIVVTATKRPQSVQDVPIAVSAFSAEMLEKAGITDLRDMTQLSPSLFLTSSQSEASGAVARIRGIGTTGDNPGLESAVAVFIDGVYRNRTNVGLTELGAVESIEVLRGPQGTLFGRNASAGLISITTKQPGDEFEGYGEVSYGNYDAIRVGGGLSGPIVEGKLSARVDGVYMKRDGFFTDKVTGEDYNDRDRYLIRGQLRATPNEDLNIRLIFDYADRKEECCAATTIVPSVVSNAMIGLLGAQFGDGALPGEDPFNRRSATSPGRGYQQDVKDWGISLQGDWDSGIGRLTTITSYRNWKNQRSQDLDYTSVDFAYRDYNGFRQEFETFSQEVRLNGQWGALDWLVGGYYADEDLTLNDAIRFGSDFTSFANLLVRLSNPAFPGYDALVASLTGGAMTNAFPMGAGVINDSFNQNSRNWALFTHNIISITDRVKLSLGVRYTKERKELDVSTATNNQACLVLAQAAQGGLIPAGLLTLPCAPLWSPLLNYNGSDLRKENRLTGTAALNVNVTDNFSTYVSYSRGYKGGGYNLDRAGMIQGIPNASQLQFEEEVVDNYEIGTKFRSSGGSVVLNTSIFYSDFSDFQLNTFDGTSFVVINLPKAKSYGVEAEGMWKPIEELTLSGGITYAKTEYGKNFPGAIFAQPSVTNPLGGQLWQLPGNTLTNAPRWSISGAATWQQPISSSLELLFHIDARYTSKVNTGSDLDVEKIQNGVFLLNGRIGLGNVDGFWQIEAWGRNLLDKDYIQVGFDGPLQGSGTSSNTFAPNTQVFNAYLAEPRTYGVTLRGKF